MDNSPTISFARQCIFFQGRLFIAAPYLTQLLLIISLVGLRQQLVIGPGCCTSSTVAAGPEVNGRVRELPTPWVLLYPGVCQFNIGLLRNSYLNEFNFNVYQAKKSKVFTVFYTIMEMTCSIIFYFRELKWDSLLWGQFLIYTVKNFVLGLVQLLVLQYLKP